MYYCIIHRPEADLSKVDEIDAKYDPYHGLVSPHVTLVFPIPAAETTQEALELHIANVAKKVGPFAVRINDTELSFDQWLFLTPTEGKTEFTELHDTLYGGEFERFWRKDLPYSPHIGVGHFGKGGYSLKEANILPLDEAKYNQALEDIEKAHIDLRYTATEIELIGVDDGYTKSWSLQKFKLGDA